MLLWDVDPATGRWSLRESLTGHTGDVFEVEIDPEGSRVVTVSRDNRVIVWDVGADVPPGPPQALDGQSARGR